MTNLITDERVAHFVSEKIGRGVYPPFTAMGIEKDGRVVAGAVFNCFTGYDCHFTIAAEHGAITRKFLREMGRYVRDQMGCGRITIITNQDKVAEYAVFLGGKQEGVHENYYGPGQDAMIFGITKERWIF